MTSKEYNSRCTSEARNKRSSWNIGMDTTSSAISVSSPCSSLVSEEESSSICLSRLSFVTASRIVFIFCLAGVAAVLGYSADRLLSDAEVTLACEQFKAISGRALKATVEITKRQGMGAATLASVASTAFPDADMWPNVKINGFEKVSNNIIATSNGRSMGLLPLVTEDQLGDFEAFLYDEVIAKNCPNGTGVHSFGKGVNGNNPALNTSDNLYHETDGETYWGSPYHVMTPYLYHSYGCAILTFNLHSYEIFGRVIDDVITCSKERANLLWEQRDEEGPEEEANIECSTLSDLTFLYGQAKSSKSTPAAVLIQAIHPENDNRELVGMISSTIEWSDILFNVFSSRVIGIDCVLETDTKAYTYQIQHGIATTRGEGDLHDNRFNEFGKTVVLNSPGVYSNYSATYRLTLYPNEEFFSVYRTSNPSAAATGAILIILFTSCLFLVYDRFVRKKINSKKVILQAKKQHVRYISHEVRTPLNAVNMGLQLMQSEMSRSSIISMKGDAMDARKEVEEWIKLSEDIHSNTQNAVDVLNDLLNYDKIETGTMVLELGIVSIWSLLDRAASEFVLQARQKSVDFKVDFGNARDVDVEGQWKWARGVEGLKVIGDGVRITQVIRNLISNGLKFTPEKGNVTIKSSWIPCDCEEVASSFLLQDEVQVNCVQRGILTVAVTDSGAGLSTAQAKQMFGKGVQFNVNKLQSGQGSGLGLYIAKGIVNLHGGSLTVSSRGLGLGTTFTMTLPLYRMASVESPNGGGLELTSEAEPVSSHKIQFSLTNPLRVLVVDDAAINRKLLMRLLQNHDHECDQAEDGVAAVAKVQEAIETGRPYNSILLDYEMPNMNGPEAASVMRQKLGCTSFIVGITGNIFSEDVQHFRKCGADRILPKPLCFKSLEEAWLEAGVHGWSKTTRGSNESSVEQKTPTVAYAA